MQLFLLIVFFAFFWFWLSGSGPLAFIVVDGLLWALKMGGNYNDYKLTTNQIKQE
jgi:hypothetical protein